MLKHEELSNPTSCINKAKDDERVFVLLGRDPSAPAAIRAWAQDRVLRGKNKFEDAQIMEALECARLMEAYGAPVQEAIVAVAILLEDWIAERDMIGARMFIRGKTRSGIVEVFVPLIDKVAPGAILEFKGQTYQLGRHSTSRS